MNFYHFTSSVHFEYIEKNGLSKGEVPITPVKGTCAVWLTVNPNREQQRWTACSLMNKKEIRISVMVDKSDSRLIKWSEYAKEQSVPQWWYDILNNAWGGDTDNWYLFFGTIKPEEFTSVDRTP